MEQTKKKKQQNIKKIDQWQADNVERIVIKPRLDDHISDRIQALVDAGKCKSKQAYIIEAVKVKLAQDEHSNNIGIPKSNIGIPNNQTEKSTEPLDDALLSWEENSQNTATQNRKISNQHKPPQVIVEAEDEAISPADNELIEHWDSQYKALGISNIVNT